MLLACSTNATTVACQDRAARRACEQIWRGEPLTTVARPIALAFYHVLRTGGSAVRDWLAGRAHRSPRRRAPHLAGAGCVHLTVGDVRDAINPAATPDLVIHAATPASAALDADDPDTMFAIVVDSPPGTINPRHPESWLPLRTSTAVAFGCARFTSAACSRNEPWMASTPIFISSISTCSHDPDIGV